MEDWLASALSFLMLLELLALDTINLQIVFSTYQIHQGAAL